MTQPMTEEMSAFQRFMFVGRRWIFSHRSIFDWVKIGFALGVALSIGNYLMSGNFKPVAVVLPIVLGCWLVGFWRTFKAMLAIYWGIFTKNSSGSNARAELAVSLFIIVFGYLLISAAQMLSG